MSKKISTVDTASNAEDIPIIQCPFSIIVDSSEQAPFLFRSFGAGVINHKTKGLLSIPLVRKGLKTGDYSIEGYELDMSVERKSKNDFFMCMGSDRDRFEKQIARLSQLRVGAIVIEASWESVFAGTVYSNMNPVRIFQTVFSWQQRYPTVHWHFCFSRRFCERVTFEILRRYWFERNDKATKRRREYQQKRMQ